MRFGFCLPVRGPLATGDGVVAMARHGERLGFHSATIADHIVIPTEVGSKYPYNASGRHPSQGDAIEQLSLMAFVAGATERLRLVTSVMILPHRNPLLAAKAIASIDVLSRGRVTLGVGVGWMREEFAALHAPDFAQRGAVSDEYIEIFKKLWTTSPVSHAGKFYSFGPVRCEPLPVQKPHPPIWIGGHSKAALRRAARYGDGWHPLGGVETAPLPPPELARHLEELKRLTEAEGRDFSRLAISFVARLPSEAAADSGRARFSGTKEEIAADVLAYERLGVADMIFDFRRPSLAETMGRMDRFASEVMPLTRG